MASSSPVYFGTYTRGDSNPSQGIYRSLFDSATGSLTDPELVAKITNPAFLAWHPTGSVIYAVIEAGEFDGESGGGLVAWRVSADGGLTEIARRSVGASGPCHLSVDGTGKLLVVANYGAGSITTFPLDGEGMPGERSGIHEHSGSGPNQKRQEGPHAHGVTFSPGNRFVLIPDLGIDRLKIYRVDSTQGVVYPADHESVALAPGAGPRHLAFSPDAEHAYAINELDNTVTAFAWTEADGTLETLQTVHTLPDDWSGQSKTAEIDITSDGRWVAASNRGHESIAIFRRDPETGRLERTGIFSCGGEHPRSFAFSPCDRWIVVANQDTNDVSVFAFDPETGSVTPTESRVQVGMPVCVLFPLDS